MQIRKTYTAINPELLYQEIKDFVLKQGMTVDDTKLTTYSLPSNSSAFISRGTLTFKTQDQQSHTTKECLRVHLVGPIKDKTKVIFDVDDTLFPQEKLSALQDDLDFIFGSYEVE